MWLCDHGQHGSPASGRGRRPGLHRSVGGGFHTVTSPGPANSSLNHDRGPALGVRGGCARGRVPVQRGCVFCSYGFPF